MERIDERVGFTGCVDVFGLLMLVIRADLQSPATSFQPGGPSLPAARKEAQGAQEGCEGDDG
jgi:hypothetical protein